MKDVAELIATELKRLRTSWLRAIIAGVLLASAIYIFTPLFKGGYLQIPGTTATFQFDRAFTNLVLTFDRKTFIVAHTLSAHQTKVVRRSVSQIELKVENNQTNAPTLGISFQEALPVRITGAEIDEKVLSAKDVSKFCKTRGATYRNQEFAREAIVRFVRQYNDTFSNFVITILMFGLIPLLGRLGFLLWQSNFEKQSQVLNRIESIKLEPGVVISDVLARNYLEEAKFYNLLQVGGPALGFLLTVSSLISSINTSEDFSNDISGFLSGLHIAMVSTLLGLLVRIIAVSMGALRYTLLRKELAVLSRSPERATAEVVA